MYKLKVFLLVIVALTSSFLLHASPLRWTQLSTKNGLLQNTVYAITREQRGFIWLGTAEGLCRFDGHSFKTLSDSPLFNHSIYEIAFLNDSLLLIAGNRGIEILNTRWFTSTTILKKTLAWGGIRFATTSQTSAFCIIDNDGIYKVARSSDGYQLYLVSKDRSLKNNNVLLNNGKLLVFNEGTNKYLQQYNSGFRSKSLPFAVESNPVITGTDKITFLTICGGKTCLCRYNLRDSSTISTSMISLSANNRFSRQMSFDSTSKKLFLVDRCLGLIIFDSLLQREVAIPGKYIGLHGSNNNVFLTNTIIDNTIWLSADVEGVFFAQLSGEQFGLFQEHNATRTIIKGIYTDDRKNVFGGVLLDSFRCFNPYGLPARAKVFNSRHYPKLDAFNTTEPAGNKILIYSRYFFGFVSTSNGKTTDLTHQLFKQLPTGTKKNSYFEAGVFSDSSGLLSYENKLYNFVVHNNRLQLSETHNFPGSITAIGIRHSNFYFIGTEAGLWLSNNTQLKQLPDFANYYIKHIKVTDSLVVVSTSSGLLITDYNGRQLKKYSTENHKLLNNTVYGTWFNNNNIWGSCNAGLFHINIEKDTVFHYRVEDGVQDNEFNSKAFSFANGRVLFGGVNGINEVMPQNTWFKLDKLNAYLSEIKVNNRIWPLFNEHLSNIYLNYTQNTIDLKFAAIAPSMGKYLKYQYRLNGLETDFHPADGDLTARYIALPPGEHVFEVCINGFEQSITKQLLTIHIALPYWQTIWFRSFVLILIAVTIYVIMKSYFIQKERKMRSEIESLTKIQKERERISRDLHDNAGSLVTYMLMQLDTENAVESKTMELKHTARTLMNTLRETIWTLAEHPISNYEFCDKLITYVRKYVPLEVTFSKQLGKEVLLPKEAVLNMYRICQEVFNNILKHSRATRVEVSISSADNCSLKIRITDNGIGFDTDSKMNESGMGMRNMMGRAKESGLGMELTSRPGTGTTVTLSLENKD